MKRFISLCSVLLLSLVVYSLIACAPQNDKGGIQFFDGTLQEALNKAKIEQKPIFIDIYATWCGPCKMLKRKTFTNKDVGSYFNTNYISLSLDGEKGDGAILANKYSIPGYPTLIVLNKNGDLVNLETGYLDANGLLAFGKQSYPK
jgi:thioredoxin 1